jgi:hypothetical protein
MRIIKYSIRRRTSDHIIEVPELLAVISSFDVSYSLSLILDGDKVPKNAILTINS